MTIDHTWEDSFMHYQNTPLCARAHYYVMQEAWHDNDAGNLSMTFDDSE